MLHQLSQKNIAAVFAILRYAAITMFAVASIRIETRNHDSPKRFELIAQARLREFYIMAISSFD